MPKDRTGKEVGPGELSELFGVSTTTVQNWQKRGCPTVSTKPARFDTFAVHRWLLERDLADQPEGNPEVVDFKDAQRRKIVAEAKQAELDVAEREGQIVDVDLVALELERVLSTVRLRFEGLPASLAPKMQPLKTAKQRRRFLEDEFRTVLEELSDGDTVLASALAAGKR